MWLMLTLITVAVILTAIPLIAIIIIIKELLKCWWRATEEWREKKWRK